jgi:hypothetical protein
VGAVNKSVPRVPSVARRCMLVESMSEGCKQREDRMCDCSETMEPAPPVGRVFFPLDEELALLPGSLTPKHQEHLAHLGSWMPFDRARQMLERLLGVQISEPSVRRGTERAGALYEARQTAQSTPATHSSARVPIGEKLAFSTDGAYVPLVGGNWAEVRTVVIGEVKKEPPTAADEVHSHKRSYFSRMTDAVTFGDLAEVEMRRRGVSQANAVCAVTDGAAWIQGFIDLHRSDALRILDFPHAAEHLGLLIEALQQAGVSLPANPAERCLHVLKHRGPDRLLRWCERLPETIKALEVVQKQLEYFRKRVSLMQYPAYQQQGWPIGSGMVESANKVVVQARLKGAGMHWQPRHVNPMLALRTAVCSERFDEAWHDATQEHCSQLASKRHQLATSRLQSQLSSWMLLLVRFGPPAALSAAKAPLPPAPRRVEPAATLPGSSCPSAFHPWKRGPSCSPRSVAKI